MNSLEKQFQDPSKAVDEALEKETKLLHNQEELGDEFTEPVEFYDSLNDMNWRKPKRNRALPSSQFKALFRNNRNNFTPNWRNSKVAAKHLKYCPGDSCRVWLQLHHFATNYNMEDGLDIYCIECNNKRKNEKQQRKNVVTDKFVQFCEKYDNDERFEINRRREVYKRIKMAMIEARGRFKRDINIEPDEIIKHLFEDNQYHCTLKNQPLTTNCFLDHHQITFEIRKNQKDQKVLDVICSDCEIK